MAKNYAALYNSGQDSISLEQRFYVKKETAYGTMVFPTDTDFFFHLPGGQIAFEQPFESSPQRSGRHHSSIIKKKKVSSFSFSTYFNIDEAAGTGILSIDTPVKVLWESLLGYEDSAGPDIFYNASVDPATSFSIYEVGDKWARQTPGGFISGGNVQLPGDGEATVEWSGNGKTTYLAGIALTQVDNSGGNTITVLSGEGARFTENAAVMLVEADGLTRSADTPAGSPRQIVSKAGDVVTVDGAALADADGAAADIYLVYYEPEAPTAINNPVTGLTGSVAIVGLATQCIRNLGINIQNNHELVDYCFGEDGLAGTGFVAGDRMTAELSLSMNMNHEVLGFFNGLLEFPTHDITAILGDVAGRHAEFAIPQARFQVPGFTVPDTGSIPVEFSGTAYESALGAFDELTVSFK
jgi:hypothetical protein